jgi:hypothetical protein
LCCVASLISWSFLCVFCSAFSWSVSSCIK